MTDKRKFRGQECFGDCPYHEAKMISECHLLGPSAGDSRPILFGLLGPNKTGTGLEWGHRRTPACLEMDGDSIHDMYTGEVPE